MNTDIKRLRMYRLQFAFALLCFAFAALVLLFKDLITDMFYFTPQAVLGVGLVSMLYGVALLLLLYLRGAISLKVFDRFIVLNEDAAASFVEDDAKRIEVSQKLLAEMTRLSNDVETLKSVNFGATTGDLADIATAMEPMLSPVLVERLEKRFARSAQDAECLARISEIFLVARQRLQSELNSLGRRSNLNLVIGVITTVMAILLLGYMVLLNPNKFDSLLDILSHYVPRVTLVIFIEVFSFFFLRLYRATLSEIHIYQNDLTSLAIQHIAVETAWAAPEPTARAALSKELLSQRNADTPQDKGSVGQLIDPDTLAKLLVQFSKVVIKSEKK